MTSSRSGSGSSENDVPFSKRDIKSNPVIRKARQTPNEARERRREMFMKKVENSREEGRWKGRSEQILRSDYLAQRRRWEQERDREAHLFDLQQEELLVEEEQPHATSWPTTPRLQAQPDDATQDVDEIAQMEEEELRAILEMQAAHAQAQEADEAMHMSFQQSQGREQAFDIPSSPTRYGSDDEDYDDIFMELLSSQQAIRGAARVLSQPQDAEMMDMT